MAVGRTHRANRRHPSSRVPRARTARLGVACLAVLCVALSPRPMWAQSCFEACAAAPLAGCVPAGSGTSLRVLDKENDGGDLVMFTWKGDMSAADVGSPTTTTGYSLCMYGLGTFPKSVSAPFENSTCRRKANEPCWEQRGEGFVYRDPPRTWGGLQSVFIRPRPEASSILVRARGRTISEFDTLPDVLPVAPPAFVTVQFVRDDDPTKCWEAVFPDTSFVRNDSQRISAKLP